MNFWVTIEDKSNFAGGVGEASSWVVIHPGKCGLGGGQVVPGKGKSKHKGMQLEEMHKNYEA